MFTKCTNMDRTKPRIILQAGLGLGILFQASKSAPDVRKLKQKYKKQQKYIKSKKLYKTELVTKCTNMDRTKPKIILQGGVGLGILFQASKSAPDVRKRKQKYKYTIYKYTNIQYTIYNINKI